MASLTVLRRLLLAAKPNTRRFASDLDLKNIYPTSSLKITTPAPPPQGNKFNGYIPLNQVEVTYSRSSGPGGQHVNTVNTKVDLRVNLDAATFISAETKAQLKQECQNRINKEGFLVIKSELTRYQQLNLADALEKLRNLIRKAEQPKTKELSEETQELIYKRQEKAARERLHMKRHRSQIKADRQI